MYQLFRPSLLLLVLQSNGSLGGLRGQGRAGDEQEDPVYIPTYHPALAAYLLVENQNNLRLTAATGLQMYAHHLTELSLTESDMLLFPPNFQKLALRRNV